MNIKKSQRAGCYRNLPHGKRVYGFTRKGLREATRGHDLATVLEALEHAGALLEVNLSRVPDGRIMQLYWVDVEKLPQ
jgi:putative DNA primase/helicase